MSDPVAMAAKRRDLAVGPVRLLAAQRLFAARFLLGELFLFFSFKQKTFRSHQASGDAAAARTGSALMAGAWRVALWPPLSFLCSPRVQG